jgi:hypothetical protein
MMISTIIAQLVDLAKFCSIKSELPCAFYCAATIEVVKTALDFPMMDITEDDQKVAANAKACSTYNSRIPQLLTHFVDDVYTIKKKNHHGTNQHFELANADNAFTFYVEDNQVFLDTSKAL